ncbi:MAG: hypothetical protein KatS3mg129_1613 [Leptospiraceae bacterium]|nr:MAG: hypothetical protein KatS3mg129_1613 [Leptospiraceae bacterium]
MMFGKKKLKKFLFITFSFVFILSLINTPLCNISCNFAHQSISKKSYHCHSNESTSHKFKEYLKNNKNHYCDYLHYNADNYLKTFIILFVYPYFKKEIILKEFSFYFSFIHISFIKNIPKFILYCIQLK